ncbi:MAG: ribosome biogenesis factor YjgA [Pseudomonadales bacterium]|jgi:ribosome-associated protein|nr:ribosome biogenesis factor YjgA [Pseudomonadales bacterium]MDP6825980.1 ribosome biogenesis factor YjgA [Pseudomonadales bacterium]|tara:strand:- start:2379 stop:2867 length:489 start_codon:yes stop_codon:yes gene_type:complete
MTNPVERPSKSELKRRSQQLVQLGQRLAGLSAEALSTIPMSDDLAAALTEGARITSNPARKRHRQYVGHLMREEDIDTIEQALANLERTSAAARHQFHQTERWRDALLSGTASVDDYIAEHPLADRSRLRRMVHRARTAADEAARKKLARTLFRWLRDDSGH